MSQRLIRQRNPSFLALASLGAGIFAACLFGIYSRPDTMLANYWPSNALLLGWLLRQRRLAGPVGWAVATCAYLAADLLTGSSLELTLHMTVANLTGVTAGYLVLRKSHHFNRLLLGPLSILTLLWAAVLAAASSAAVALPATQFILDASAAQAFSYWFSAELIAQVTLLPTILLASKPRHLPPPPPDRRLSYAAPFLTLLASAVLAVLIGGPGAPAFPIPALLWCALIYPQIITALITLVLAVWTLLAIAWGQLDLGLAQLDLNEVISLRIGVALIVIAPLTVASMTASRERLLKALHHAALFDTLTGVLSRAGFFAQTGEHIPPSEHSPGPSALMVDVDNFKRINDRHGHAAGDAVLSELAQRLRLQLPDNSLIGRLGGEEFAIFLRHCDTQQAAQIAEQLRERVIETPFPLMPGLPPLAVSISIGIASLREDDGEHIETLLYRADQALYRAKVAGRNRVVVDD